MLRHAVPLALAALLASGLAPPAAAQNVLYNPNFFASGLVDIVRDGTEAPIQLPTYPIAFPASGTTMQAIDGDNTAQTTYAFDQDAIVLETAQAVSGVFNSISRTTSSAYFEIGEDTLYTLEGTCDVLDGEPRNVDFRVLLHDITSGPVEILFETRQQSLNTVNESFVLGEEGGDNANFLVGALSGTLLGGSVYRLIVDTWLTVLDEPPRTTVAMGATSVTLTFVPEPGATGLGGAALVALAVLRRRGPRRASGRSSAGASASARARPRSGARA